MWDSVPVWCDADGDWQQDWGDRQGEDAGFLLQIQVGPLHPSCLFTFVFLLTSNGSSISLHRGCFALQFVQTEENCPCYRSLHLSELTPKAVMWCFFCTCPHKLRDLSSRREYGSLRGLCTHREGPNDWKTILNLQTTPLALVFRQLFCPGACQSVINNNIYNTFSIEFLSFAMHAVCLHLLFNY